MNAPLSFRQLAVPLAALTLLASAAQAATQGPAGMAFYAPPVTGSGPHGELVSYRKATVNLGSDAPAVNAWNVLYRSTDSRGAANVVTGTVLVPKSGWLRLDARPIISYAVGTHGLAQSCAPSLQMAAGTDYETANIVAALKAGYAVVVSDYQGYTNGATPTYLSGASQGNAVLDIVSAAVKVPFVGLSSNAKVAVWGYSQGGQSAAWAGQLQPAYAPNLKLVGVAAGGVPGDFKRTARVLDGSAGAAFLFGGVIGLSQQYPDKIPLNTLASESGKAAIEQGKQQCVFESLFTFMNSSLSEFTVNNQGLESLMAIPSISEALTAQDLGGSPITAPVYQYHGQADEFIPLDQAVALKKKYCARATNVTFDLFPSEHIATQFQGAPYVLSWLADRVDGKAAAPSTCSNTAAAPQSTANPAGGNFVVSLDKWLLNASVNLKTLKQTVTLPATSSLTADADITAGRLNGALSVPEFKQKLSIIGIPANVGLRITPVGETTGTVALDNNGRLKIKGTAYADITVTSVLGLPFGECKTQTPVAFPLDFEGPVSSMGNGKLVFTGTTTFPPIKGCAISAILSTMMSGAGQTFSFAVSPPAPVKY